MVTIRYRFGGCTISYTVKDEAARYLFVKALATLGIPILSQQFTLAWGDEPCRLTSE